MPEKLLYEYAIIRYVPQVEREEFINLGVILFCKQHKCIKIDFNIDIQRIEAFSKVANLSVLQEHLLAFKRIAEAQNNSGVIGALDAASRFRWLTAVRSSVIQTSRPHPGFSYDLDCTLSQLMTTMVLQN